MGDRPSLDMSATLERDVGLADYRVKGLRAHRNLRIEARRQGLGRQTLRVQPGQ